MLILTAMTPSGEEAEFHSVQSLVLQKDFEVPADSMTFVLSEVVKENIAYVVLKEDGREVYRGVVDEQNVYISSKEQTEFVSRSTACVLLDNEACPATFFYPDARLLTEKYLAPLGVTKFSGENRVYPGEFKVAKGMSCWQVMESFASKLYGMLPVVQGDTIVFRDECDEEDVVFSLGGENPPIRLEHRRLRCKPLSAVRVRTPESSGYTSVVYDKESVNCGIRRERYLNVTYSSSDGLQKADRLISAARSKSETVRLVFDGRVLANTGVTALVEGADIDISASMYISSLRYVLDGRREQTEITLKKKEN